METFLYKLNFFAKNFLQKFSISYKYRNKRLQKNLWKNLTLYPLIYYHVRNEKVFLLNRKLSWYEGNVLMINKNLLSNKTVLISAVVAVVAVTICAVFIFRGCNKNETAASDNAAKTGVTVASDEKKGNTAAGNKDSGNEVAGTDSEKLENEGGTAPGQTGNGSDTSITAGTSGDNSQGGSQNNAQGGNQGNVQNGNSNTPNSGSQNGDQSGNQDAGQGGSQDTSDGGSQNTDNSGNQDAGQGGNHDTSNGGSQNGDQGGNQDAGQGGNEDAPQDELPDFPYECYVLTERLLHNIYGDPMYYVMGFYVPVDEYNSERASLMRSRLFERSEELYGQVIRSTGVNPVNEQGTPMGYTDYKTGRYYFVYVDHTDYDFEYKGY